jgi:phenylpropionate dioxygenase-like ring-hydroxylating dioxygenase large terminal subunit
METSQLLPHDCTFAEAEWTVLSRHWYPVAYSDEVEGKPLARKLLDEELIIYRTTSRQVVVARDLCIHRGVPLHFGWQEGDELVCAYHGFRYGPQGKCTLVPAQPNLPIPSNLCLHTYPSIERYGLIWTCLSSEPAGDLPAWPELEDPVFKMMHDPPPEWNATAGRTLENFLDVVHFAWIHAGTFGNRERPEVPSYDVEKTPGGIRAQYLYVASNPEHSPLSGDSVSKTIERCMTYDVHLPFACRLSIDYGQGRTHCIFDIPTPVSERKTRIFFFIARNFDLHVPERELLDWENAILSEDKPIVEGQRPERLPLDLSEEFHIRGDRLSTAFRQALRRMGLGPKFSA